MNNYKDALKAAKEELAIHPEVIFEERLSALAVDEDVETENEGVEEGAYRLTRDLCKMDRVCYVDVWEIADCINTMLESEKISEEDLLNYGKEGWTGKNKFVNMVRDFIITNMIENRL